MRVLGLSKRAFFFFLLAATMAFCLGPVLWQIISSLKPNNELIMLPPILPVNPTLSHYVAVFTDYPFARIIGNSLMVATTTTLLSLGIGSIGAFALARLGFKGKGLILGFALAVSMFPPVATVSPLYLAIRVLGLRDTWWALIIAHTTFALPLALWILNSFFREIPGELYNAALIDGCSPL